MEENQLSRTALATAFQRGYHALHENPKIFDDPLSYDLLTEEERLFFRQNYAKRLQTVDPDSVTLTVDETDALERVLQLWTGAPGTLSRFRYAEEALGNAISKGVSQYVILGAGMDTFAFRRPEIVEQINVFEVDHPAMQNFKQKRIKDLNWRQPEHLQFIPLDFTKNVFSQAILGSSYNRQLLSFFSWLGVTPYLSQDSVFATLCDISKVCANGSMIVFDYLDKDAYNPTKSTKRMKTLIDSLKTWGEPLQVGFDPSTLSKELSQIGLELKENLDPSVIQSRYFQNRKDNYCALEHLHFALAEIK